MIKGFIKDTKLLEESPKVPDSMEWTHLKENMKNKIRTVKRSSTIALVGPFGSGKSTMLDKIGNDMKNKRNFWFNFEAWKYPERENLWENFIYDFAISSGVITKEDIFKIIHGELTGSKKFIKNIISLLTSAVNFDYIGDLFTENLRENPISRINDYQELLDTIICKLNKPIFITIEDIDRSGDYGLFFLETLKNYLEKSNFKKRVLFLVPISTKNYEKEIDRYLKVIDYFEFFNPSYINFLKFAEDYISDDLRDSHDHLLLADFLSQYFSKYTDMTLRKLKLIMRQANIVYINQIKDDKSPDWRLTLCAEMMKFTKYDNPPEETFYQYAAKNKLIPSGSIFSAYIYAVMEKQSSIIRRDNTLIQPHFVIKTIPNNPNTKEGTSAPWLGKEESGSITAAIFLEDFYFSYN